MMQRTILTLAVLSLLATCQDHPDYESMVKQAAESEVREDSLFLGYYLGMTNEDFREHSWNLNQQQKITGLSQVEYAFDELPYPATMLFYPEFYQNRIVKMPISVRYDSWSPWNRRFSPDSLAVDLVELYSRTYDADFHKVHVPNKGREAFFAVTGNRGIMVYPQSDSDVSVEFLDLAVKRD